MKVTNQQMMPTCPFEDYLALPGWSYSGIKMAGRDWKAPTSKMMLGTSVHNYLLTPNEYKHENIELVRPMALELKNVIGPLIKYLKPEVCVTADFIHEGFAMKYKGRLDLSINRKVVIDLKISEMDISKAIEFFGYNHQQSGYARGISAEVAFIISINPKTFKTKVSLVNIEDDWWNYEIIQKGEPIL